MNTTREKRLYELIGENIKKLRLEKGLNQNALASKIQLSRTSVVNIEQGRQHPSVYLLWQIASTLQMDITDLLPKIGDMKTIQAGLIAETPLPNTGSEVKDNLLLGFKEAAKPVIHDKPENHES